MVSAQSYKYPGVLAKHWLAYNPRLQVFCFLQIDNTMAPNVKPTIPSKYDTQASFGSTN